MLLWHNRYIAHVTAGGLARESEDFQLLRALVPQLKRDIREKDSKISLLEAQCKEVTRQLRTKEGEVARLEKEIYRLKGVLRDTQAQENDFLSSIHSQHSMAGQASWLHKKQGVSGESGQNSSSNRKFEMARFDKDFRSRQLIKDALMENAFLQQLDGGQVREMLDHMYPREVAKDSLVIREGDTGSHLFVSALGELEVLKNGQVLGRLGPGKAFGELAILYNCTRTASIRAVTPSKVWVLDRRVFQQVMMRTGMQRLEDNTSFLQSVNLLQPLHKDSLARIADVLQVEFFPAGEFIVREGTPGDTFYLVRSGRVKVMQRVGGHDEEVRVLERGDYFGEQALMTEDVRTASVMALPPGVECLVIDRDAFNVLIGDLRELRERDYGDDERAINRAASKPEVDQEFIDLSLHDIDVVATLGIGGFGRVELVQLANETHRSFALKCLKKRHIRETQQQEHIFSEKNIMMGCKSNFVARLYKTFKDIKYVYMLMEVCLGGELWTILRDRSCFDDMTARFYTACVVEAFDYLHSRGIIYRDLKPENLMLDNQGYCKLVDFGFSKRLSYTGKTWTFCGTPEYVAPEVILNKGHDRAVDLWSLGVLMFELLTGAPPFTAPDPMKTYNIILKGIDMIEFPRHITPNAKALIKRFCREIPQDRLGYGRQGLSEIRRHKWFGGFDWDGLRQREVMPPIIPQVRGATDISNFDSYHKDSDIPPDDNSGWDEDF